MWIEPEVSSGIQSSRTVRKETDFWASLSCFHLKSRQFLADITLKWVAIAWINISLLGQRLGFGGSSIKKQRIPQIRRQGVIMYLAEYLRSERGVVPMIILWAILIGLAAGGLGGFIAYLLTSAASGVLVGIAITIIFFVVILPNLATISAWWKKVINQFKHIGQDLHTGSEKKE